MQSIYPRIFGNEENKRAVGGAVLTGTLSHAYIIEGAEGMGKETFARETAAALACQNRGRDGYPLPCGECPSCKKILTKNAADVKYYATDTATFPVDKVRAMREDMYLSAVENDCKVYIVRDAEKMNPQAQNALLIVLEEPPTDLVVFLLTERADALLTTVRSRAQLIRMRPLSEKEMESALSEIPAAQRLLRTNPDGYRAMLAYAGGCLGRALDVLDPKKNADLTEKRAKVLAFTESLVRARRHSELVGYTRSLPRKRPELIAFLGQVYDALADLIRETAAHDGKCAYYTNREDARTLAASCSPARLFRLSDLVAKATDSLQKNANVNLTLLTLLSEAGEKGTV